MANFSRRGFLLATGWVASGVTAYYLFQNEREFARPTIVRPTEESAAGWLQIKSDGTCRMYCPRMEMGQNANTGLAQIVAEELNINFEDIELVYPNTNDVIPLAFTAGSLSLALYSRPIARAAANLREALRGRAANISKTTVDRVIDGEGGFITADDQSFRYVDLVGDAPVVLGDEELNDVPLYSFDATRSHQQIGRTVTPFGMKDLVTGAPVFTADVPIKGVLFGRALKPPVRNASIRNVDTTKADLVRGLVKIVRQEDFVGVVCETPGSLDAATKAIEIEWSLNEPINQQAIDGLIDVDAALVKGDLEQTLEVESHQADAAWDIDLRFEIQVQTHAQQEPRSAIARLGDGKQRLEIWTGTQDAWAVKRHAADDLGLDEDQVVVYPMRMGGGFGGREHYDVEKDAARLAMAVGRPVKAQWTREDEFTASRSKPSSSHRIRLAANERDQLTNWWHAYVSGHVFLARDRLPNWLLPFERRNGDLGVVRGAHPPYDSPHKRVECEDVDFPIDLGVWRSLNGTPNTFVIESAMDELARQRNVDPVSFRLSNMSVEASRLSACLRKVESMAQHEEMPLKEGYGRGFACGIYEHNSYVAVSADIYVDPETKNIQVQRMCCVQDVGLAVNPDQLRAQIESNLVWSIGTALLERLEMGDGMVVSQNFHNYLIPRMGDVPRFEIEIISDPKNPPAGAGEVALIAGTPAIANAVRDATGIRPLRLPIELTTTNF